MTMQESKYARIERERRFLLARFPEGITIVRTRRITDRYIDGATLRLREQRHDGGPVVFKLTQKVPAPGNGAQQGLITNIYLTEREFELIARLPAKSLSKIRYSAPPSASMSSKARCKASFSRKRSSIQRNPRTPWQSLLSLSVKCPLTLGSREVNSSAPRAMTSASGYRITASR
jgi:hypothetical protein